MTSNNYLYFIEPVEDDEKIQDWDGGLKAIKRTSKLQEKNLNKKLDEMQKEFVDKLTHNTEKMKAMQTEQIQLKTTADAIQAEQLQIKSMLAEILNAIKK